jgi:putative DNA methylase
MMPHQYCKRLIEIDIPIKRISELALTTEKKFPTPRGHISTLHTWWARRPTAVCRAVLCASLWPDPVDSLCPKRFKKESASVMKIFQENVGGKKYNLSNDKELRSALLSFIAEFSAWTNSTNRFFLETSQKITTIAHEALGGIGTRPLVFDSFAGGGAIPLEALRIGCNVFASDINPVAVLLNKVVLDYMPKFGNRLSEEIIKWSEEIKKNTKSKLEKFYITEEGDLPLAYIWARTVHCEGPGCGAKIPLLRSLWISKKSNNAALRLVVDKKNKQLDFEIINNAKSRDVAEGTVKRSAAICPICGYTTPAENVRKQFINRQGGANDSRMIFVVTKKSNKKYFRLPTKTDVNSFKKASEFLEKMSGLDRELGSIPDEPLPYLRSIFNVNLIGINKWVYLFNSRQLLAILVYQKALRDFYNLNKSKSEALSNAVLSILTLSLDKLIDFNASLCQWRSTNEDVGHVFGRQALGIVWDYAETNLSVNSFVDWDRVVEHGLKVISYILKSIGTNREVHVEKISATSLHLPDDCASIFFTDPPYYDLVPYADLSDFFYIWLKRLLKDIHPDLFDTNLTPKKDEIVQLAERNKEYHYKTKENYELLMKKSMEEARRILGPHGLAIIVFAHKETHAWESQLKSMVDAGWVITASWPIDTEMGSRLRAQNSAVLASSIHLICRPREDSSGALITNYIGDWRDVLQDLPIRIHDWMPRLAKEGVVGADAIFACLGPALEVFSKYSYVEKSNGEKVELKEYLEQVWAAVAKEALNMIFEGARTEGFEEDARLTAMWLWTLSTGVSENEKKVADKSGEITDEGKIGSGKSSLSGFSLEFDAARLIAQGLGANLENLNTLVEIKGDHAHLLSVAERGKILFGKDSSAAVTDKRKKKDNQMMLFPELDEIKENEWSLGDSKTSLGKTILDRLHQAMILFGTGRGMALRKFLVEESVGKNDRFWCLAQALSALYPKSTDEKRWVDGVLAKKKSFGF